MTTLAEAQQAPTLLEQNCFALRGLLQMDETRASDEDKALVAKILAATTSGEFMKLVGTKAANSLFTRGVIYFGRLP
jgi:hypothetical protein